MSSSLVTESNFCNHCGNSSLLSTTMIAIDADVFLCDECIKQLHDLLETEPTENKQNAQVTINFTPRDVVNYLDSYIVGQEDAKKTLSLAAYQHYKKMTYKGEGRLNKSNVLMLGPTGSGKTALIERLAEYLNVPFVVYDSTQLTESGFVGDDVADILAALYRAADGSLEKAQMGIVCLDEVDKIHQGVAGSTKDQGLIVQRMLLKTLESNKVRITEEGQWRGGGKEPIQFDTTNVLFIGCGAFSSLPRIIQKRLNKDSSGIGFNAKVSNQEDVPEYDTTLSLLDTEDLVSFGYMPEFIGRFGNITNTKSITVDMMKKILTETKNSPLLQIEKLLLLDKVTLDISDSAIEEISKRAVKHKTGARALPGILHEILKDVMFEYPSNMHVVEVIVDFIDNNFWVEMFDDTTIVLEPSNKVH
jgi:ATP-dependent Clp protease ATP-binding subunit ClpX